MLKPLFAYIVVAKEKLKSKSVLIPVEAQKRNAQSYGKILSVGPSCADETRKLVGKTVLLKRLAGDWVQVPDQEEVYVVHEDDLLAVVEK